VPGINGTPGNDVLLGSEDPDSFTLQDGGDDSASGAGGNDGFYFGGALTAADSVDGGAGSDTVALQGDYAAGLTFGDLQGVETFLFLSGSDTRFGDSGTGRYSSNITATDPNVPAGSIVTIVSTGLLAGENLSFNGSAENDGRFRIYAGIGIDQYTGGAGSDGFFFGADGNLTGADRIDGGGGVDTVALRGDYAAVLNDTSLANIEVLALLSGHTNEFTGVIVPSGFSYDLTMAEGNVAAGLRMDINATRLGSDESLGFDGGLETDGAFRILSGAGNDTLAGSQGADIIYGGLGADIMTGNGGGDLFQFRATGESSAAAPDRVTDFAIGDTIDLSAIDANSVIAGQQSFGFIGASAFSGAAGQLRAIDTGNSLWRIEADVNGDGVADMAILAQTASGFSLASANSMVTAIETPPPPTSSLVIGEVEPNNSIGAAQAIDRTQFTIFANGDLSDPSLPSAIVRGNVSSASDVDFFSIHLDAGEKLVLDVDHAGALDSLVAVYGPDGLLVGENDDRGLPDTGSNPPPQIDHNWDSFLSIRATVGGTYTFSIKSFEAPGQQSSGGYDLNVSIGPVASAEAIRAENQAAVHQADTLALISGAKWPTTPGTITNLTYSFPASAVDYADYAGQATPENSLDEPDTFHPLEPQQIDAVHAALASLSGFSELAFTEIADNPASAQLRYAMSDVPDTAYAYYPDGSTVGGDSWYNFSSGNYSSPVFGNYDYLAFFHETGHALGLKHGHEAPALSADHDSMEYSIMTYRSFPGAPITGYRNETFGYAQSYMMYDIAALQSLYGADFTTNGGDSVYRWGTGSGRMFVNDVGQGTPGANRIFLTIWDGGGTDTYDLSNYDNGVTIDLRPGEWTITSPVQLANLGQNHMARGNIANALLYDGDPRSLIENAIGGSGADTITANQAVNHLTGNGGADTFIFNPNFATDVITDFHPGEDILRFDHTMFASASDVISHMAEDGHGNAIIAYDANNTITIQNVGTVILQQHQSDFHIV
jgi:Ca2+-binding RTX toxin-like protein